MKYKYSILLVVIAAAITFFYNPTAGFTAVLGSAENFTVLGSSTVTNTGETTVNGDLGVNPGSAIVGFDVPGGPGTVNGTIHGPDGVSLQARNDAITAYTGLTGMPITSNLSGQDLGGLVLTSGVYHFDSSAQLTGLLTLNAEGLDNAFWVFQIGSTLTTAHDSSVEIINPGMNNGLFWQVGSSATLGTDTAFLGNILADQSVTLTTNASILCGRVFALNGAVTMDSNNLSDVCGESIRGFDDTLTFGENGEIEANDSGSNVVPEPATLSLLGLGFLGIRLKKKYRKS